MLVPSVMRTERRTPALTSPRVLHGVRSCPLPAIVAAPLPRGTNSEGIARPADLVCGRGGRALRLTRDHKPSVAGESERIRGAGGELDQQCALPTNLRPMGKERYKYCGRAYASVTVRIRAEAGGPQSLQGPQYAVWNMTCPAGADI